MTKYRIYYWTEKNDVATDEQLDLYAYNEVDAMKQFLDRNIVHKKVSSIEELV